ncbi:hypothetical protein [Priestia flexa]|uniref:hypothetical protein n=1 Tax=Priestia flexa TaxID=86664 RepID=UPI00077C35C4|nr:hypothetical protein [Priestia flexa]MED4589992.1 hypothetical protein [Priestia flexa]
MNETSSVKSMGYLISRKLIAGLIMVVAISVLAFVTAIIPADKPADFTILNFIQEFKKEGSFFALGYYFFIVGSAVILTSFVVELTAQTITNRWEGKYKWWITGALHFVLSLFFIPMLLFFFIVDRLLALKKTPYHWKHVLGFFVAPIALFSLFVVIV